MIAIPIALNAERITALVVGGGVVGTRRALALLEAGASVTVIGSALSPELPRAAAENERLSLQMREYAQGDIKPATIVFAATDSREVNARIASDAVEAGCLVSIADDPEAGNFHMMAAHRTGEVTIGVSAGGVPAAAVRIRDMLATRLMRGYGEAVGRLAAVRRQLIESDRREEWRRISSEAIGERFCETVEKGELDARIAECR